MICPPLLENRLYNTIKTLGHDWLWIGNEFVLKGSFTGLKT